MNDIRYRPLHAGDYDGLLRVWADSGLPYKPRGRESRVRVLAVMERTDSQFIGALRNGVLVGTALATYDGRKGWINRMAVQPDYRRCGIGAGLIVECERFLESRGAEIIACLIESYNLPSMGLFQKSGYLFHDDVHYFSKRKSEEV